MYEAYLSMKNMMINVISFKIYNLVGFHLPCVHVHNQVAVNNPDSMKSLFDLNQSPSHFCFGHRFFLKSVAISNRSGYALHAAYPFTVGYLRAPTTLGTTDGCAEWASPRPPKWPTHTRKRKADRESAPRCATPSQRGCAPPSPSGDSRRRARSRGSHAGRVPESSGTARRGSANLQGPLCRRTICCSGSGDRNDDDERIRAGRGVSRESADFRPWGSSFPAEECSVAQEAACRARQSLSEKEKRWRFKEQHNEDGGKARKEANWHLLFEQLVKPGPACLPRSRDWWRWQPEKWRAWWGSCSGSNNHLRELKASCYGLPCAGSNLFAILKNSQQGRGRNRESGKEKENSPMSGKFFTALGVDSASRSSRTKKATKIFIPLWRKRAVRTKQSRVRHWKMILL